MNEKETERLCKLSVFAPALNGERPKKREKGEEETVAPPRPRWRKAVDGEETP